MGSDIISPNTEPTKYSFKPNFTTGNSPHYYKKNISKKKKRLKENILFNKRILKKTFYQINDSNINV